MAFVLMYKNVSLFQGYHTVLRYCETAGFVLLVSLTCFEYVAVQFIYRNAKLPFVGFPKEMYIKLKILRGACGSYIVLWKPGNG